MERTRRQQRKDQLNDPVNAISKRQSKETDVKKEEEEKNKKKMMMVMMMMMMMKRKKKVKNQSEKPN